MKKREEKAIDAFRSGLNCAQAVVAAYSDDLNFDIKLALSMSCGFGAGMGRLQETCGAVTGSFMVLGILNCRMYSDNKERKDRTYSMIQQFNEKFRLVHTVTDCKSLIKCDLKTEEGQRFLKENNIHETICEKCIADAVTIVDALCSIPKEI